MSNFTKYRRSQVAELTPITSEMIADFTHTSVLTLDGNVVSISSEDILAGSPKIGDMIGRNPKNHNDKWLVAKQYFEDNFEEIPSMTKA